MKNWNPQLYLKYQSERTQPSIDLASRIRVAEPISVIDLGCGPGNSTVILKAKWPKARICGLDNSPDMIERAKSESSDIEWVLCEIENWRPAEKFDVIFTNAALQWVSGHKTLFPTLVEYLKPEGVLAVQVPFHYASPLHLGIIKTSRKEKWNERMSSARSALTFHDSSFYYDLMSELCQSINMWETEYYHIMESPTAVLNWISGTGLIPFMKPLNDEEQNEFKSELLEHYNETYELRKDGKVIFPFKRQFMLFKK